MHFHHAMCDVNESQITDFFVDSTPSQAEKDVLQCRLLAYPVRVTNMLALKQRGSEMEGNSSQLETRVVRLETRMEHMDSNISRIMADLHDLRTSTEARFDAVDRKFDAANEKIEKKFAMVDQKFDAVNAKFDAVNEKFDEVNDRISKLHVTVIEKFGEIKVWALTVLGVGILTVVARALHWI